MPATQIPFALHLDPQTIQELPGVVHNTRRLSHLRGLFADAQAEADLLAAGDPLIYAYGEAEAHGAGGTVAGGTVAVLSVGMTRILPGTVGAEYYMTRGHFHTADADGDEVYLVLQGCGMLLLMTRAGERQVVEMSPHRLCYVPAGWAHRTVNTGDEDLLFASVWPRVVGHDYTSIARRGFGRRVLRGAAGPEVVEG